MSTAINEKVLQEAADWAMTLHYESADESQRQAFEHWHAASPAHRAAWAQARNVLDSFEQVPGNIGKKAIKQIERNYDRRALIKALSLVALALPAGWAATRHSSFQAWASDVATGTGERKQIELPDGSRVVLNTRSSINISFDQNARRIQLVRGEILISTQPDPASTGRPFLVDTPYGLVRALGTKFGVRHLDQHRSTRVSVFESAVEIQNLTGNSKRLDAGSQLDFSTSQIQPAVAVEPSAALWEKGMLMAKDMRLADLVNELGRYRPGILRCDPAVANLLVSGSISVSDTDAALRLLERNLAIRIERISPYWVTVTSR